MSHEPREIVKNNAESYRSSEELRMEKERLNKWLSIRDVPKDEQPVMNDYSEYIVEN